MIKWYENPDHRGSCHWGDEVLHFDVSWNRRRCFVNNADCSNCGCLAGSLQNPLKQVLSPREMMKLVSSYGSFDEPINITGEAFKMPKKDK